MRYSYPLRVYALVLLVCLSAAGWAVTRLSLAANTSDPYRFDVQFRRLAGAKKLLASQARAGYFSNIPQSDSQYVGLYFPTQYVLAPTLLVPLEFEPDAELVLGNFTRQEDYSALGRQRRLEIVREFPLGVVLYRRLPAAEGSASPRSMPNTGTSSP